MTRGPVADTTSALEFRREIDERMAPGELWVIANELADKSKAMTAWLTGDAIAWDRCVLRQVLGGVFSTRRHADGLIDAAGEVSLALAIDSLLNGAGTVDERLDRFDVDLAVHAPDRVVERASFDLPSEILHFTRPERYWLWTRWIWDPAVGTGALALLSDDHDLGVAGTRGATYLNVGRTTAILDESSRAAGLIPRDAGPFAVDVLLAATYGIYMHTVLGMRMTREFNRVIPALPELVRRLLGVASSTGGRSCR